MSRQDPQYRRLARPPAPFRRRSTRSTAAFTLVEILIVVVILGILAAIVLPGFTNAAQSAREATLKDELRFLRSQVGVFRAQHHDVPPGYPNCNLANSPDQATFITQMTSMTNELGAVGTDRDVYKYGPYLSQMPPNPINKLTTVLFTAADPLPVPDGSTGWIYNPTTLQIAPNLTGNDTAMAPYATY